MLTGPQSTVLTAAAAAAGGPDALARASVAGNRRRPADPAWSEPRPRRPGSTPTPAGAGVAGGVLPAASAVALVLRAGQRLWVEQLDDGQGVDVRAFGADGRSFSAAETRAAYGTAPTVGARLLVTPGRPLLTVALDSAPGHDLLYPPCCAAAYAICTGISGHRGCAELATEALARLPGHAALAEIAARSDDVLNLWLPTAVAGDGAIRWWPARARAGDVVALHADADVVVAVSSCPDDMFGTSQYEPKPVRVTVFGDPDDGPAVSSPWPQAAPEAAIANRHLVLELADDDLAHLDAVVRSGWLGGDRAAVMRALLLRHLETTLAPAA
jgi:uncharacterized protein YcgI (DUF1989 family)